MPGIIDDGMSATVQRAALTTTEELCEFDRQLNQWKLAPYGSTVPQPTAATVRAVLLARREADAPPAIVRRASLGYGVTMEAHTPATSPDLEILDPLGYAARVLALQDWNQRQPKSFARRIKEAAVCPAVLAAKGKAAQPHKPWPWERPKVKIEVGHLPPPPPAPAGAPDPKFAGLRYNTGKPSWALVPFDALEGMVRVLQNGAQKYAPFNWQRGLKTHEVAESLARHLFAWMGGEDNDPESGESHIGHIQCNALFLAWLMAHRPDCDTRHKPAAPAGGQ